GATLDDVEPHPGGLYHPVGKAPFAECNNTAILHDRGLHVADKPRPRSSLTCSRVHPLHVICLVRSRSVVTSCYRFRKSFAVRRRAPSRCTRRGRASPPKGRIRRRPRQRTR